MLNSKKITNILLFLSLAVLLFGSGYRLGERQASLKRGQSPKENIVTADKKNIDFSLFWEAWDKLEQKFIDKKKLNPQQMFYGAIKGMVSSLEDPYTFFLTPDENKKSKDDLEGRFEGIGAQLGLKDKRVIIIAPLKDSPAERAGVKAGDFINKVDDRSTTNWTLSQAVAKIRGPKGTKVKLSLERNGKEFSVEIVRETIRVASVELSYKNKVAILKLNQFGENTNDEWDEAIEKIKLDWERKNIKGLVLDVRDNPGGYLESSVYLASEFLPRGKLVVKQESTTTPDKEYAVLRRGRLLEIPLVVLVNKGSASASEILAGALRDHKRAVLIGEKTFGKGSVQEALELSGNAGLHVTVAKWILPSGDWINSRGIEPSIKIENKIAEGDTLMPDQDRQLQRAVEEILK